jgi:N-acetylglutamate synthase-like GNAT family acetyltransferase
MAMLIRSATNDDTPAIIELLRNALGESTIPKSEALWLWKHEQNPFGPSHVLVAEENNTLVGLRAFMQWQWLRKGKIYQAVRAVDTATHTAYQGRGIFKKLTLQQVENCRQQGIQFVFNTPNEQSRPGYLKMGWVQQGRMPLKCTVLRPFAMVRAKLFNKDKYQPAMEDPSPFQKWTRDVLGMFDNQVQEAEQLTTVLSSQYISWRYANNPLFRYNYFTDHENFLVISRIKNHSFAKELRMVDFVLLNPRAKHHYLNAAIKSKVLPFCREHNIGMISFSGQQFAANRSCFKWMGPLPVMKAGPLIALRDLNMKDTFRQLIKTRNWCYSIGDLELF